MSMHVPIIIYCDEEGCVATAPSSKKSGDSAPEVTPEGWTFIDATHYCPQHAPAP